MTYILTEDGYEPEDFPEQFETIVEKYMAPQLEQLMGQSWDADHDRWKQVGSCSFSPSGIYI